MGQGGGDGQEGEGEEKTASRDIVRRRQFWMK